MDQKSLKYNSIKFNHPLEKYHFGKALSFDMVFLIIAVFFDFWHYRQGYNLNAFKYLLYHILYIAEKAKNGDKDISPMKSASMFFADVPALQLLSDSDIFSNDNLRAKMLAEDYYTERSDGTLKISRLTHELLVDLEKATENHNYNYNYLIAIGNTINALGNNDPLEKERVITAIAKSMVRISEKNILYVCDVVELTYSAWINIEYFFNDVMRDEIVKNAANGPTLVVDGRIYIDWITLLYKYRPYENSFKYQTVESQCICLCC